MNDAVMYLLPKAHSHLDNTTTTLRITFFDFFNAFNTIQPLLLREKIGRLQVDMDISMIAWIPDYLSDRSQFVQLGICLSECLLSSTGAAQRTVLSPFLFTLYSTDFQ